MNKTNIDTETSEELRIIFRAGIIKENPEMEFQPELLEQQILFCLERADKFEQENISDSEIADQAYKVGLHDNKYINREISTKYDFSRQ